MKGLFLLTAASVCLLTGIPLARAQQLGWQDLGGSYNARYQVSWRDARGSSQSLRFTMPRAAVQRNSARDQNFKISEATQAACQKVTDEARYASSQMVQIGVQCLPGGGYRYSYRGDPVMAAAAIDRLRGLAADTMQNVLGRNNYRLDGNVIEADYTAVARKNFLNLSSLAEAIRRATQGESKRQVANYVLSLLQTIPYETYTPKPGDGERAVFNTPLTLFGDNKGDCDEKSLAFGTLMRLLYPNLEVGLVLVPNHAFAALGITPEPGDLTATFNGKKLVLAEPVGPDELAVGHLGTNSLWLMMKGIDYRPIPDRY